MAVVPAGMGNPGFLGAEVLLQTLVTPKIIISLNFELCERSVSLGFISVTSNAGGARLLTAGLVIIYQ